MKKITMMLMMLLAVTFSYSQTTIFSENFDAGTVPANWEAEFSTGDGVQVWTFGSGVVPGAVTDFSTNAAIFDDDAAGDTGNHDMVWLWYGGASSSGFDVTSYGQVTLHYDYALNENGNGETLSVGLWDGAIFIPIKVYDTDTNPTSDSIDITAALNANPGINASALFIGFGYDDNTSFGWGAGIDNVLMTGSVQPVDDSIFVQTATVANITFNRTIIDHPDLNGNPDAKIVVSHNWNPGGASGVYNDNVTGVWYNGSNWTIFNEDPTVDMVAGPSFNVYIRGNDSNVITHIASPDNEGAVPSYTVIDNPLVNGDPNAILVMGSYFNPNNVFNDFNYGFWYEGSNWIIYAEDGSTIPTNAAFNVIIEPSNDNVESFKHQNNASNTVSNYTIIDHPLLNGKPNAVFVFSHNWGASGDATNVTIDKALSAWYTGSNWSIYTEDQSAMPDNALFNIVVMNSEFLATNTLELINFNIYPNPVTNILNIDSEEVLTKISVVNLLGQEVKYLIPKSNKVNLDLSGLNAGVYVVKLTAGEKKSTKKFIKQ